MATPLTADQQLAAIRAEGCRVAEYTGWRDRGLYRARTKDWAPQGVVIHHTAGGLGSRTVQQYIRDILVSDRAVPDKCNVAIAPDGTVWMVAAGRANHMLYYSQRARDMAISATWPTSGSTNARGSLQNGNSWTYGVECIAAGTPNAAQRDAAVRWAAALCRAHGWSGGEVFGHGEAAYDRGFSDPGWDMGAFRRDVMARLKAPVAPEKPPVASPKAHPQEDPVPELREDHYTFDHHGKGFMADMDNPAIGPDVVGPIVYGAEATVTGPEGAQLTTRWAVLNRKTRVWTYRSHPVEHAGHQGYAAINFRHTGDDAESSVYLDVACDRPGLVKVEQHAAFWRVR